MHMQTHQEHMSSNMRFRDATVHQTLVDESYARNKAHDEGALVTRINDLLEAEPKERAIHVMVDGLMYAAVQEVVRMLGDERYKVVWGITNAAIGLVSSDSFRPINPMNGNSNRWRIHTFAMNEEADGTVRLSDDACGAWHMTLRIMTVAEALRSHRPR